MARRAAGRHAGEALENLLGSLFLNNRIRGASMSLWIDMPICLNGSGSFAIIAGFTSAAMCIPAERTACSICVRSAS